MVIVGSSCFNDSWSWPSLCTILNALSNTTFNTSTRKPLVVFSFPSSSFPSSPKFFSSWMSQQPWRWCSNHHRLRVDTDMVCLGLNLFDYRKIDRKRFSVAWRARCQARHRYLLWLTDLIKFHWPDDISAEIPSGAKRNQQGYLWPLSRSHPGGRKSIWVWSARAQECPV